MTVVKQSNIAILVQTLILVITLIGIAIAADRRVTVVEENLKAEITMRNSEIARHEVLISKIEDNQSKVIENQSRVTTVLEMLEKAHRMVNLK